jgi:hypothetical protein
VFYSSAYYSSYPSHKLKYGVANEHTLLPAGLLDLRCHTDTNKSVVGFELLQRLRRIINERKSSGLSTTILSSKSKDVDFCFVGLVELGKFISELLFRNVGSIGM